MSNKTIGDYSAAVGIDGSADYLLIEQSSVYKKINRNTLLGLASTPLGLTDTQSPTNKTFDNTNAITIKDGSFTLQNSSSTTKQAVFSLASITAGQTRTITVPDASITLVGTAATQTLTNKTLTSPTITGGTIDNSTITVDSIGGHTSATIVTVANLQISNGVLNTNNSVVTANLTDGAVTPAKLTSGTGSGWAWSSWTPTWTNLTVGNAVVVAKYIQIGKTVFFRMAISLGSTSSISGLVGFSLPVTAVDYGGGSIGAYIFNTQTWLVDAGVNNYPGWGRPGTTSRMDIYVSNASGTYTTVSTGTSSTVPFTWGNTDSIICNGEYEAA